MITGLRDTVPKMYPIPIDSNEFTEQTEHPGALVCAGGIRRNSFRINGISWDKQVQMG